jgi:DNA polymerase IIIc chi subunit
MAMWTFNNASFIPAHLVNVKFNTVAAVLTTASDIIGRRLVA